MVPGYKTSECWITVALVAVAIAAVIICVISPNAYKEALAFATLIMGWYKAHTYEANRVAQKIESMWKDNCSTPPITPPIVSQDSQQVPPSPVQLPPPVVISTTAPVEVKPPEPVSDPSTHQSSSQSPYKFRIKGKATYTLSSK